MNECGKTLASIMLKRRELLFIAAIVITAGASGATAATPYDFHGLLFTCGRYPPVNFDGKGGVYAYESDLTTSVTGKAVLGKGSVTVSLPRRFLSFTITKRGKKFFVGKTLCEADDV